jgi:hypothetical protein
MREDRLYDGPRPSPHGREGHGSEDDYHAPRHTEEARYQDRRNRKEAKIINGRCEQDLLALQKRLTLKSLLQIHSTAKRRDTQILLTLQ